MRGVVVRPGLQRNALRHRIAELKAQQAEENRGRQSIVGGNGGQACILVHSTAQRNQSGTTTLIASKAEIPI
jgi:hypothetical protein